MNDSKSHKGIYYKSDGKLHKGFIYSIGSHNYFAGDESDLKKKRTVANESNYYGIPFKIYSATPGYQYKDQIRNYFFCYILVIK